MQEGGQQFKEDPPPRSAGVASHIDNAASQKLRQYTCYPPLPDRNSPGPPSAYTILRGQHWRRTHDKAAITTGGSPLAAPNQAAIHPASHLIVRPLKSLPLRLRMADSAVGISKNSMNPNPRGFPVSRSVTMLELCGSRQGNGVKWVRQAASCERAKHTQERARERELIGRHKQGVRDRVGTCSGVAHRTCLTGPTWLKWSMTSWSVRS